MRLISPESAEFWKSLFEAFGVVLLGATFVAGLGFWYFGRRVNEFQTERLRKFDKDLTDAKSKLVVQEERAASAELQLEKVKQDSGNALKDAAIANQRAGEASRRAEELKQQNLETESRLETERKTRLELEKSLSPRELPIILEGGKTNFDSLKPFAGMQVIFDVLPDAEALRAAGAIRQILEMAGWKTIQFTPRGDINIGYFDGVMIESLPGPELMQAIGSQEQAALWQRLDEAGEALEDFLSSNNWEARATFREPNKAPIPPSTIKIVVGFKPNPYFAPEWAKKMNEEIKKSREEMKKRRAEIEKLFQRQKNK